MVQVTRLLGLRSGEHRHFECRLCGSSVSNEETNCPDCGFSGIGSYELS